MSFTKAQRNAIFGAIVTSGVDPAQYDLRVGKIGITIKHLQSGSKFYVEPGLIDYNIAAEVSHGEESDITVHDYAAVLDEIIVWVQAVVEDAKIPDLWSDLQRYRKLLSDDRYKNSENTPFTPDEQGQVIKRVREIQSYIEKYYDSSDEQASHIEARLEEAAMAGERIGRKDWILLFTGTMSSLIVTDSLPPQVAQHALIMILQGLAHLFGLGGHHRFCRSCNDINWRKSWTGKAKPTLTRIPWHGSDGPSPEAVR